jgi:hypothetical protein
MTGYLANEYNRLKSARLDSSEPPQVFASLASLVFIDPNCLIRAKARHYTSGYAGKLQPLRRECTSQKLPIKCKDYFTSRSAYSANRCVIGPCGTIRAVEKKISNANITGLLPQ